MPSKPSPKWPFRWDLLLRYRFIETIALWEGRLTTRHLCDTFGIGRQQASKDINNYNRAVGPHNLEYDKYLKGYKPTGQFTPVVTRGLADEYLHLMARNNELLNVFESLALDVANAEVLTHPVRQVRPEVLRPLMQAARQQKRLDVDYVSVNHPDREGRIIVPHTVVYTGLRWHVRGWCEKNQAYRDFVLSRFRGEPEIMNESEHGIAGDTEWNLKVTIRIAADQRLTAAQREVVEVDYGMQDGVLEIPTRARLVTYVLQLLNIKPTAIADDPTAQQIVVQNREELAPWLFG
ncbi:helix-turn-helix transcriptional regulator [Candidatus Marimicrobium litorale]|uniref:WYL domain-containing protein n=1 Tax=Candidatus Marimicrobium litorale TaxID=2518991 RepID=A0ABT3T1T5_9GAMM|nr:WYL domain-containing protein [Candidatus Marimicrobium litorale]MCX2976209.1 WYL domain-containing protein [Candidatus Marimicrobium litorale]